MDPRARFELTVSLPRCGLSARLVALALEKLVYPKLLAAMDSTVLSDNRPRHLSDRLSTLPSEFQPFGLPVRFACSCASCRERWGAAAGSFGSGRRLAVRP